MQYAFESGLFKIKIMEQIELNYVFNPERVGKTPLGKPGRPAKTKSEKEEVQSIYNPETAKAKKLYAEQEIRARARRAKLKPIEDRKKVLELKLRLQRKYYHEFQAIEFNKYGSILEHPKYKFLGRIFILGRGSKGEAIREYYFPEDYTQEKYNRKVKSIQRRLKKDGTTAHELRMRGVPESDVKILFG